MPPIGTKLRFLEQGFYSCGELKGAIVTVTAHDSDGRGFSTTATDGDPEGWEFSADDWQEGLEIVEDQPPARQEGETPRCDEILLVLNEGRVYKDEGPLVTFARTLERELSAKQAEVERLTKHHKRTAKWLEITSDEKGDLIDAHDAALAELESLKAAQGWRPGKEFEDSFRKHVDSAIIAGEIDPETDTDCILSLIQGICADIPTPPVERSVDGE